MGYLRTSDVAKAVGAHPNTVRRYVDRRLLPPVEYSPSGYRRFTQRHLDCLRIAYQVTFGQHPGLALRQSGMRIVRSTVNGDLERASALARDHLALVQSERAQADIAADLLERWAAGALVDTAMQSLQIGQAARALYVTIDVLRSWDRNGLIDIPRDP